MIPKIPDGLTLVTDLPAADPLRYLTMRTVYNDGTATFVAILRLSEEEVQRNMAEDLDQILLRVLIGRLNRAAQTKVLEDFYLELRNWIHPNNYRQSWST